MADAAAAVPKMGTCGLPGAMSSAELARLATSEGGGVFVGGGVNTAAEAVEEEEGIAEGTGTEKRREKNC